MNSFLHFQVESPLKTMKEAEMKDQFLFEMADYDLTYAAKVLTTTMESSDNFTTSPMQPQSSPTVAQTEQKTYETVLKQIKLELKSSYSDIGNEEEEEEEDEESEDESMEESDEYESETSITEKKANDLRSNNIEDIAPGENDSYKQTSETENISNEEEYEIEESFEEKMTENLQIEDNETNDILTDENDLYESKYDMEDDNVSKEEVEDEYGNTRGKKASNLKIKDYDTNSTDENHELKNYSTEIKNMVNQGNISKDLLATEQETTKNADLELNDVNENEI